MVDMRTNWMGSVSLMLSAITLVVVLYVATRPAPQSVDPGPALVGLQSEVSAARTDIAALRATAEQPAPSANVDQLTAIQSRLDSLNATVGAIATKFAALCTAINASPIGPPGGAC
jgi:type II secretory pathway component PulM